MIANPHSLIMQRLVRDAATKDLTAAQWRKRVTQWRKEVEVYNNSTGLSDLAKTWKRCQREVSKGGAI